jgi:hypothetical protein
MIARDWQPKFAALFTLDIEVHPPLAVGATSAGNVRVIPFRSGVFEGPGLRGRVLEGGSDWQEIRADGALEIRARYLLETDDGERIEVRSEGVRSGSLEVLARLDRGDLVAPEEYYFRTAIRLRTAAPRLARLNDLIAFSRGERLAGSVRLEVCELL